MVGKSFPLSLVITGIDNLTGPLRRINAQLSGLKAPLQPLSNGFASLRAASREFNQNLGGPDVAKAWTGVTDAVGNVGDALRTTTRRFSMLGAAGLGLGYVFKREFIETASQFEDLQVSLEGIEGSAEKAKRSMAFIKDLAVKTPFQTDEIAATFRLMRASGMEPTNGSLQAIVDQVAKVGGGGDKLIGIAMQLGQAWGKGRLMAQDANILVENGVPVWGILERAVKRVGKGQAFSVAQLRKMSEAGKLDAKVIALLIEQMGIESAGASKRMMGTWTGLMSNLVDKWTFFKLRVMEGGAFDVLKGRLQGLLDTVDRMGQSGDLDRWADLVGNKLVQAFEWLFAAIPKAWAVLKSFGATVAWAADLCGGWANLLKVGLVLFLGGPLIVALAGLTAAVAAFGWTLALTPVGWFLGALALLAGGATLLVTHWGPITDFFARLWDDIKGIFSGALDFITGLFSFDGGQMFAGAKRLASGLAGTIGSALRVSPIGMVASAVGGMSGLGASAPTVVSDRATAGPALRSDDVSALVRSLNRLASGAGLTVTVNGPAGVFRATKDPGSAPFNLNTGLTMAESH